jgi:streptogrisin C
MGESMMKPRSAILAVTTFAAIAFASSLAPAQAGAETAQSRGIWQKVSSPAIASGAVDDQTETKDPLAQDALWLSEHMGLKYDDAYSRLKLQEPAGKLEETLASAIPDSFAGLWLDQGDQLQVVIGLTAGDASSIDPYLERSGLKLLVDVVPAKHSLSDLNAWTDGFLSSAIERFGSLEGKLDLGIDIPANRIVLKASDQGVADQSQAIIDGLADVDVQAFSVDVDDLAQEQVNVWAGFTFAQGTGGNCTTGFSTRTTTGGQRGISTAAHCANTMSYGGTSFPFQAGDMQGNQDVQWHSIPSGFTALPRAQDQAGYRTITGTLGRANQPVGALVCGFGITTGYRCGRITFKNYAPSYINSPAATFIVLHENGVDLGSGGDSGGPWYSGGVAYGIHSGSVDQVDAIYMAINYISSLSVAVLTG